MGILGKGNGSSRTKTWGILGKGNGSSRAKTWVF